jgi:hypothetical protein
MPITEELIQFGIGCCGGLSSEVLHWHRIARRGRWPRYAKSLGYWVVTLLLIACGGAIAAAASPAESSALQLLIIGIAGPQLLQAAAQSRIAGAKEDELYLGSEQGGLLEFLGS